MKSNGSTSPVVCDLADGKFITEMSREEYIFYVFNDFKNIYGLALAPYFSKEKMAKIRCILGNIALPSLGYAAISGYFTEDDIKKVR
jgi:hypothetical protein